MQTTALYPHLFGSDLRAKPASKSKLWTARVLLAIITLFLLFDGIIHVLNIPAVKEGAAQLGFPPGSMITLGIVELACLALYLIPRTSVLGAILLTGYLGGAIATHVRADNPLFSHTLFPVYLGVLIWGVLFLRDTKLRALFPVRS